MSENTERLDAIQKRVDADLPLCSPSCPSESCQTAQDRAFLLDLARKQRAALERVEALADTFDGLGSHASYHGTEAEMETWLSAANHLRAALEPTP